MSVTSVKDTVDVPKGNVRFTLSREHSPVVRVSPGTTLRVETELNIGDVLHSVTDKFEGSMLRLPFVNGATGPIAVDSATPDQILSCTIDEMELVPPGFTALIPGVGAFPDWIRRREFGVHSRVVDIVEGHVLWDNGVRI